MVVIDLTKPRLQSGRFPPRKATSGRRDSATFDERPGTRQAAILRSAPASVRVAGSDRREGPGPLHNRAIRFASDPATPRSGPVQRSARLNNLPLRQLEFLSKKGDDKGVGI